MAQAQSVNASTGAAPHPGSPQTSYITTHAESALLDAARTVAVIDSLLDVVSRAPLSGSTPTSDDRLLAAGQSTDGRMWLAGPGIESLRDSRDRLSAATLRVATLISRLESDIRPHPTRS